MSRKKTSVGPARWALLVLSLIVLGVLAVVFFKDGRREFVKPTLDAPPDQPSVVEETSHATKEIVLFFPAEEDSLLHPERRSILSGASVAEEAKRAVEELIKGSAQGLLSPLPDQTRLRELFITRDGTAYVDFSREFMEKHPSGSSAELTTVYSVVNSLTYNFKPIKKVFILVDGGEKETLGGHINLSQAFTQLSSLIAE